MSPGTLVAPPNAQLVLAVPEPPGDVVAAVEAEALVADVLTA